jgi:hypothetical protein
MARGDVQLTNPALRFFKWSGGDGILSYYDKEKKENIEVPTPFTFLLLDTFTTIKGFNEKAGENIWANEIKDLKTQKLNVRSGKTTFELGFYADIKDSVVAKGGGYAQSCYICYKENGELVIGNITMQGSSFSGGTHKPEDKNMKDIEIGGWLSFAKTFKAEIYDKAVQIVGKDDRICTNGKVKFYAPVFKLIDTTPETNAKAIELTQKLKAYMKEYFVQTQAISEEDTNHAMENRVNEAHANVHNTAPATLTEQEKTFLVKEKPQDAPLQEMGELPMETSFVDDSVDPDDLPF